MVSRRIYLWHRHLEVIQSAREPPEAVGVYENQPSPVSENVKGIWGAFLAFAIFLLVLMAGFDLASSKGTAFDSTYFERRRTERRSLVCHPAV